MAKSKSPSQIALEKVAKKHGLTGTYTSTKNTETTEASTSGNTTQKPSTITNKPTDYSSAVKYLQDRGVQNASGIMTEHEWGARNRNGGTYQDYLDGVMSKYGTGNTDSSPTADSDIVGIIERLDKLKRQSSDEYFDKRYQDEFEKAKTEGSLNPTTQAIVTVDAERKATEKEIEELTTRLNRHLNGSREASLYDSTIGAVKKGYYNMVAGKESFKQMQGEENEAEKYKELLYSDEYNTYTDSKAKKVLQFIGEFLGQQAYYLKDPRVLGGTLAAGGIAFAAGQAGPQALAPEELLTVPGAMAAAYTAGTAVNTYETSAGHTYATLKELGISDDVIAGVISHGAGLGIALLEGLQLDELMDAYVYGVTNGAADNVLQFIASEILKRGKNTATETVEEELQELVSIGAEEFAYRLDKGEGLYTKDDVLSRLGETAETSLMGFGAMNIPAATFNATRNVVNNNRYKKADGTNSSSVKVVNEYKNAVDENLIDFVQGAKTNTTDNKSVFKLKNINDRMAGDISELTGINAKNYGNVIKANSIRHIIKDHGVNGETDSSMADDSDIARIQYVIDNYPNTERAATARNYVNAEE